MMPSSSVVKISHQSNICSFSMGGKFNLRATLFRINQESETITSRTWIPPPPKRCATLGQVKYKEKVKASCCITIPPALKSRSTINSLSISRRRLLQPKRHHCFIRGIYLCIYLSLFNPVHLWRRISAEWALSCGNADNGWRIPGRSVAGRGDVVFIHGRRGHVQQLQFTVNRGETQ